MSGGIIRMRSDSQLDPVGTLSCENEGTDVARKNAI